MINRLDLGTYTLPIVRIHENRKSFGQNTTTYVHDIYFEMEDGREYKGEYLSKMPTQHIFKVGETCCFRVVKKHECEIERCPIPGAEEDGVVRPADFTQNVGGKSYNFALAYAKDIAVAQIRAGHKTGYESDFNAELLNRAWEMHQWLLDPKSVNKLPF